MYEKVAYAALYAVLVFCAVFDQRALVRSGVESETHIVVSALGTVILPPIYIYTRARDTGMKKWRWLLAFTAITLGCIFISTTIDDNEALKTSACEITTSIFKDKSTDVQCLAVEDVKKVSDKHYRAKAVLSNGEQVSSYNFKILLVSLTDLRLPVRLKLKKSFPGFG